MVNKARNRLPRIDVNDMRIVSEINMLLVYTRDAPNAPIYEVLQILLCLHQVAAGQYQHSLGFVQATNDLDAIKIRHTRGYLSNFLFF
jgi:hypothetical protein